MIKNFLYYFKNIDSSAKIIMKKGLNFCLFIALISIIILFIYEFYFTIPFLFYIGFNILKLSLTFGIEFIICGFITDKIKKELI